MIDKQIIIDGVDVSGCNLYRDEVSFIGGETITDICSIWIWQRDYKGLEPSCVMKCHCFDNPNCYYKQLKRKEQECEELKKDLLQDFEEKDKLHLIIDRLLEASGYNTNTASAEDFEDVYENMRYEKQQLDQLKVENEKLATALKFRDSNIDAKNKEILKKCKNNRDLIDKNWKLIKTLDEIKEIAERIVHYNEGNQVHSMEEEANQILQKISECEVK